MLTFAAAALGLLLCCSLAYGCVLAMRLRRVSKESDDHASARARLEGELQAQREAAAARGSEREERLAELRAQLAACNERLDAARAQSAADNERRAALEARLESEKDSSAAQLQLLDAAQRKLSDAFQSLSAEALRTNNRSFLDLAQASLEKYQEGARGDLDRRQQAISELVKPVRESLEKVDGKLQELESARTGAYATLTQQVRSLLESQNQLRSETSNLVQALRAPSVRGRWGELTLKRVVEVAGMSEHCDFTEQASVSTENGTLRPDLIVHLPGNKRVVVDAKTPLEGYLAALEAPDEATRKARLQDHARQVRAHVTALSRKAYWDQFPSAPEFVVLFLPAESFFSAALEQDPALLEEGALQRVILATPTTLITLLRSVGYGWRQESLARNAQEISSLGRELYKRITDMAGHFSKLGRSLTSSVEHFNRALGSVESRVLVTARRFKDLQVAAADPELEIIHPVGALTREVQAPELLLGPSSVLPAPDEPN